MAKKKDAATELAERMVQVLDERRGTDGYPPALRRLGELADPGAPPELVLSAAAKRSPFGARAVVGAPKNLDSPVARVEDLHVLADSTHLLEIVLERTCTPAQPTVPLSKVAAKVHPKLKRPFAEAVRRRIQANTLPETVGTVKVRTTQQLHWRKYPLPDPPEVALAKDLLNALRECHARHGPDYPPPLSRLAERTRPGVEPAFLNKALNHASFKQAARLLFKGNAGGPVALAEDVASVWTKSPHLLETLLTKVRKDTYHAFTLAELKKPLATGLAGVMEEAVRRGVEACTLPPAVGCVRQKGKPLLFLWSDVVHRQFAELPPKSPQPETPRMPEFAPAFDAAFDQLERRGVMRNFVSLVDLRRELRSFDRPTFDGGLRRLREAGRYTLSAAEGRGGIRPEERDAAIPEDGALLLYVMRRQP
jgi:hypothetical protein